MKLVWGLHLKDKNQLHSPYVYDMFYISIQMGKDLGYETVLYGTKDAIERLGEYVDETHNTDELEYKFFDDLKIYILENRVDDYLILDGDVFLHSPLVFKNPNSFVWIDSIVKSKMSDYTKDCLDLINNFNITEMIPEWNVNERLAFSTGLLKVKGNNGLIKYYVESYKKFKNWFLSNEKMLNSMNLELHSSKSLISHYVFEHLLQRIVNYYGLDFEELENENFYYHWQGNEKFENENKIECIRLIAENHKKTGGSIKNIYESLVNSSLIKPILYP